MAQETRLATFGAGCFWHVEAAFAALDGVVSTQVGYMGGTVTNPSYEMVCTDRTGHAEVVYVEYDPAAISYEQLLELYWDLHDPTSLNRQGPDVGSQYRSVIFYHDAEQEAAARAAVRALEESGQYHRPIVTQIVPAGTFYRAEEYHQQYFARHFGLSPHQAALACAVGTPAMRHAKKP
ncbi:MAG TPA: peptide-methionine (S)-S-oxide reductase MsrA [Candidatus Binataceae bacterium]|nr:peptide-methionine (S)-S-oxide reductase MsrA [Candidatus Binataceae bacterium]